jgi:hypothetical protein
MSRYRLFIIPIAALTAILATVAATPAAGQPPERDRYDVTNVERIADYCDLAGRPDLLVLREQHFVGTYRLKSRGPNDLPYTSDHFHYTTKRTNLANGKSITSDGVATGADLKVTDNGDGTSIVRSSSFTSDVSYDKSGARVHQFVGRTVFEVLTDNGGTPTDPTDDEFLEFLGIVKENIAVNSPDLDFCEIVHNVID